jgi:hypothetical protein
LISKKKKKKAAEFMATHRKDHEMSHGDEIRAFASVQTIEHMKVRQPKYFEL